MAERTHLLKLEGFPETKVEYFEFSWRGVRKHTISDLESSPNPSNPVDTVSITMEDGILLRNLHVAISEGRRMGNATLTVRETLGSQGWYRDIISYQFTDFFPVRIGFADLSSKAKPKPMSSVDFEFASMKYRYSG